MRLLHQSRFVLTLMTLCFALVFAAHPASAQIWICKGKAGCTSPGNACTDASVFAGCPGPSHTPIYITRCDGGRTWNGSVCGGTAGTYAWNNGNASGYVSVGGLSTHNGKTNTATIIATDSDSGTGGTQPHLAAQYCDTLTMHGYDDWYLPAQAEIQLIRTHIQTTYDMTASYYYASNQDGTNDAYIKSNSTLLFSNTKNTAYNVRCARKD